MATGELWCPSQTNYMSNIQQIFLITPSKVMQVNYRGNSGLLSHLIAAKIKWLSLILVTILLVLWHFPPCLTMPSSRRFSLANL